MSTPEAKVKTRIKRIITKYGTKVYSHWPVLNGMGAPTLDCTGSAGGDAFFIEAKAGNKQPTPRQKITRRRMLRSGATVFILNGEPFALAEFDAWLSMRVNQERYHNGARTDDNLSSLDVPVVRSRKPTKKQNRAKANKKSVRRARN